MSQTRLGQKLKVVCRMKRNKSKIYFATFKTLKFGGDPITIASLCAQLQKCAQLSTTILLSTFCVLCESFGVKHT